jgi:mxaC protein
VSFALSHPLLLLLLPLALLPWFGAGRPRRVYPALALLPEDPLSRWLSAAERLLASIAITALLVALSGPYRPEVEIERVGHGAQMMVLMDRSRSMDQPFYGKHKATAPLPYLGQQLETKGQVARRLLSEFAARRAQDMFGMVIFSTKPIQVLPLTQKPEIIQAAIAAAGIGRGLAETDVGGGLIRALQFFADRPYTGSRILLLISDGAATLGLATRARIQQLAQQHRVALYWLYMRTRNSPGIFDSPDRAEDPEGLYPQWSLHQFFRSLETPYRAYTAEDPQALEQAIRDVSSLQNLPLHYLETLPRRDLHRGWYAAAAMMLLPLTALRWVESRQ